jgi:CBS domain-containing protein
MATTARDLMQTRVVTLSPDAPLHSVQRVFVEEGIHGAPVVDQEGRVLGVVTSMDILRAAADELDTAPAEPSYFRYDLDLHSFDWDRAPADLRERIEGATAADVMTPELVTVGPEAPVAAIARALRENAVHRVLVVEDGELRGIVSSMDLVGLLESRG